MSAYKKYFTVSYDDGLEQDKKIIQLMKKYGIKGTFNLNSSLFGVSQNIQYFWKLGYKEVPKDFIRNGRFIKTVNHDRIPEDEISQVYEGFEIASHGAHHKNETRISVEELKSEIGQDQKVLSNFSTIPVVGHVLPFGMGNKRVYEVLRQEKIQYVRKVSFKSAPREKRFMFPEDGFTIEPTCWQMDKNIFKLLEEFKKAEPTDRNMLFYMWGHGYELDFDLRGYDWERLERIFQYVSDCDDIICCTNAEAMTHNFHN